MNGRSALTRLFALGAVCACVKAWVKHRLPCIIFFLVGSTVGAILTRTLLVYALITTNTGVTVRPSMPVSSHSSATTVANSNY